MSHGAEPEAAGIPGTRTRGSLSLRLSLLAGLVIFLAVALGAWLNIVNHRNQLTERIKAESLGFAETIRRATFRTMLANERGHLYETIRDLAAQPGVARVRIFNATGRIMFSTDERETGRMVDKTAEACFGCHTQDQPLTRLPLNDRSRVFTGEDGHRLLGSVLPIYNRPGCQTAECHQAGVEVLGVLDVDMSLKELDLRLGRELNNTLFYALILLLGASLGIAILLRRAVRREVAGLSRELDQVATEEPITEKVISAPQEMEPLARSIERLARRVARHNELMALRYRRLVEDSPEAILVLNEQGRLVMANPEAERVLGVTGEELLGAALGELVVKEDRSDLWRGLQEALSTHRVCHLIRLRFRRGDGEMRVLQGRFRGVELEDGSPGLVGNLMDITERGEMEARLMQQASMAAVGQTAAGLVPYIRNLLHGLGNASHIVDQGLDSQDMELVKRGWSMVHGSVNRITAVSEDLIYFSDYGIESAQTFDLTKLFGEVEQMVAGRARELGVKVEISPSPTCTRVTLDHAGMRRAVLNLVNNALDALGTMRPEGNQLRITLSCDRDRRGRIRIMVADNGPGIPAPVADNLFKGLFSTKGAKGTGLGLLLCQKVVQEHGGYLEFHSQPRHTVFTIVVPDREPGPDTAGTTADSSETV